MTTTSESSSRPDPLTHERCGECVCGRPVAAHFDKGRRFCSCRDLDRKALSDTLRAVAGQADAAETAGPRG